MTEQQRQEEISKAYLHAVAARCGFAVGMWSQDHGCVDTTVGAPGFVGVGTVSRPKLDVQLKATRQSGVEHDGFLSWTLDMAHYDSLRASAHVPHILVVLLLHDSVEDSVVHSVDQLAIRRCAYWVKMTGMPAETGQTKTVRLPRENVFSPDQLERILGRISSGEF